MTPSFMADLILISMEAKWPGLY